jgi:hypothetical protein
MTSWYLTPKLKGAPSGRAITADNFMPEDKNSVSVFVREVFQNVLDARRVNPSTGEKEQAIVKFQILTEGKNITKGVHSKYFKDLEQYINKTDLSTIYNNAKLSPSAIVFEETNTVGLTGCTDDSNAIESEDGRWNLFWHSEAKESKGLELLGRAGQGKITYNLNSACGTVFALTSQEGGDDDLLFGKCRFPSTFTHASKSYLGHAFFCEEDGATSDIMPLPITDSTTVDTFRKDFKLTQRKSSGTSWVIPYTDIAVINKHSLVRAIVSEFYLAILKKELIVDIDGEKINSSTLRTLIEVYKVGETEADREFLFWLIDAVLNTSAQFNVLDDWFDSSSAKAKEASLAPVDLDDARKRYHLLETLHFRVPIEIEKVGSRSSTKTYGDVYLRKVETNETKEIYARDCLIIEKEIHLRRAPGRNFGAFIANDKDLNSFLGDADHASHLHWNNKNPRLKKYQGYQTSLSKVRSSLPALARLISNLDQARQENLYNDLISVAVKKDKAKKTKKTKKKKKTKPRTLKPKTTPQYIVAQNASQKMINITNAPGFSVASSSNKKYIKLAYEIFGAGNPFDAYHRFDFDLANFQPHSFKVKNCQVISRFENMIELEIFQDDFEITITGFDAHECRVEITDV